MTLKPCCESHCCTLCTAWEEGANCCRNCWGERNLPYEALAGSETDAARARAASGFCQPRYTRMLTQSVAALAAFKLLAVAHEGELPARVARPLSPCEEACELRSEPEQAI